MSQAGIINLAGGGGGGSPVETLTGNSGGAVPPTGNNINVVGTGGVLVTGNPGASTLTITVGGGGFTWTDKAASFNALAENGYFCTAALTATLPAAPAEGDTVEFICTTTGIVVVPNAGQSIQINNVSTSTSATNSAAGDALELIYRSTGTTWWCLSKEGLWMLA